MAERWFAYLPEWDERARERLERALAGADLVVMSSAQELRAALAEAPGMADGVVVGPSAGGVSSINLAAAVVADGHARRVVLAAHELTGSLLSRARRAGIMDVVGVDDVAGIIGEQRGTSAAGGGLAKTTPRAQPSDDGRQPGRAAGTKAQDGRRPGGAPVVVLTSARGGVGKTTLAATLAAVAESWGLRVALLDLDLGFGDLFSAFGLSGPVDLAALVGEDGLDVSRVRDIQAQVSGGISLVGPCERAEMGELVMPHVTALLDELSHDVDLVLVDASTYWSDAVAQAAQRCDRLLVVSDELMESPGAIARLASLAVRLGVARTRVVRVSNRSDVKHASETHINRAEVGLETARLIRVAEGGEDVRELMMSGHARDLATLDSVYADSARQLLARLLHEMGRLPQNKQAKRALEQDWSKARRGLFGRMREAS